MTQTATQEPVEIVSTTPSGIDVLYSPSPRRFYKVRKPVRLHESTGAGGDIHPLDESEWVEVPSVTSVLGILDKPGLPHWGNKIGAEGVLELVRRGLLMVVNP